MINIGCFGHIGDIEAVGAAGFDSIELDLQEICALTQEQLRAAADRLKASDLSVYSVSWILPMELDLTLPGFDRRRWLNFLSEGAERCTQLGASMWTFGCGKGRSLKPGRSDSLESQRERVNSFIYDVSDTCLRHGMKLALEPLGSANSNYIQTLAEAAAVLDSKDHPALKIMCDLRHMCAAGDPIENITDHGSDIIHCHIDYPLGTRRLFPAADDGFDYMPYLREVRKLSCGQLGIEAIHGRMEDAAASLRYIRSLLA